MNRIESTSLDMNRSGRTVELTRRREFFFLLPFSFCLWLTLPPLASNDLFGIGTNVNEVLRSVNRNFKGHRTFGSERNKFGWKEVALQKAVLSVNSEVETEAVKSDVRLQPSEFGCV